MIDLLLQVVIGLTGALAILLISRGGHRWARWGYVVGLVGQPFWLYVTFAAGQWGMFALSAFYAAVWVDGIRLHFRG